MLYVIKHTDGTYFHNKGKIILYETPEQATRFLQEFIQYAISRLIQEGTNPMQAMSSSMIIQSHSRIMEIDFDMNTVECGTVYATDL